MKRILILALIFLMSACMLAIILTTSISLVVYDDEFYYRQFDENLTVARSNVTSEGLRVITDEIQTFLKGEKEEFSAVIEYEGQVQEVFSKQEKAHMKDVQKLFSLARTLRLFSIIILAFVILCLIKRNHKQCYKLFLCSAVISFLMVVIVSLLSVANFDSVFTALHRVLFSNELWLFEGSENVLLNVLSGGFFTACAKQILLWTMIIHIALFFILGLIGRRINKPYKL